MACLCACSRTRTIGRVSHLRHLSIRKTSFRFSHFSLSRCEISHRVAARDDHLPPGQGNRIACWPTKEIGKGTRKCYEGRNGPRYERTQTRFRVVYSSGMYSLRVCVRVYICVYLCRCAHAPGTCVYVRVYMCAGGISVSSESQEIDLFHITS